MRWHHLPRTVRISSSFGSYRVLNWEFDDHQRKTIPRPRLRSDSAPRDRRRPRSTLNHQSLEYG